MKKQIFKTEQTIQYFTEDSILPNEDIWVFISVMDGEDEGTTTFVVSDKMAKNHFDNLKEFTEEVSESKLNLNGFKIRSSYSNTNSNMETLISVKDGFETDIVNNKSVPYSIIKVICMGAKKIKNTPENIKKFENLVQKGAGLALYEINEENKETLEYDKDPYSYYGVKRSDFC